MKPTLSLSMIVKDAEAELPACLESVRGVVEEIVVADTGSTDSTVEVARRYGAQVFSIPWEQDFARARNLALEQVRTDWVLMLDADEQLDPAAGRLLPALLEQTGADGYQVTIRNYLWSLSERVWDRPAKPNDSSLPDARKYPAYVEHENVRLFRRHPDIYFVGRVHESVGSRILETRKTLGQASFLIHHFGLAADAEIRARKNRLYRDMGRQKVREMPENAQAHFELGLEEFDNFHNDTEALACFERACHLDPRLSVAWFFAGMAQVRLGRPAEALDHLKRANSGSGMKAEVSEAQGDAHYSLGRFDAARACYRRALKRAGGAAALESKLGLAEMRAGRKKEGLAHLGRAVAGQPETAELHDRLITACVWAGEIDRAAAAAEHKLSAVEPHPDSFLRAASIRAQMQDWQRAEELLREGLSRFPEAEKLRSGLAEVETHEARA